MDITIIIDHKNVKLLAYYHITRITDLHEQDSCTIGKAKFSVLLLSLEHMLLACLFAIIWYIYFAFSLSLSVTYQMAIIQCLFNADMYSTDQFSWYDITDQFSSVLKEQ